MADLKKERKRKRLETVLPVSPKPKTVRLSMPTRTMAPIVEEEGTKKEANVTMRRPLRGCSLSIVEESEEVSEDSKNSEMPEIKKMEPEKPKNVAKIEVAKKKSDSK
ncbi:hypothetical protein GCK72_012463 [Caenorhabditis remanei]|uniref:Uncharacterized protein n=1 Tax=Caenorhabditis remanei TaxID=31234 RepID=A0A6A5GL33_CAERE|nr:hypothetical protein GCK72_012463 [Caenorhabditis remanei]KAF1756010.1 hypothetical protein GCK72_012463 [Caenorhabditis remanei]